MKKIFGFILILLSGCYTVIKHPNVNFADSSGESLFDNGDSYSYSYSGVSKYGVLTPFYFGGGVAFNVKDVLLVAGDVVYVYGNGEFKRWR